MKCHSDYLKNSGMVLWCLRNKFYSKLLKKKAVQKYQSKKMI